MNWEELFPNVFGAGGLINYNSFGSKVGKSNIAAPTTQALNNVPIMTDPVINPGIEKTGAYVPTTSDKWFGYTDPKTGMQYNGMLAPTVGAAAAVGNTWLGMKNYGLAKDQFSFQKDAFNKNYLAQKNQMNAQMEGMHAARLAAGDTNESLADYMARYGVK